jgi:hypothetical protein
VKDDGTVKCSGTGNVNNYNCSSWPVSSGSSGTTYTYNLYINGVKNDTKSKTCNPTTATTTTTIGTTTTTTTIGTTTTTIGTTTTIATGCGNGICEYSRGETQDNCREDCKTDLQLFADGTPVTESTLLKPNQIVKAIVTFNDSRYNSTEGFDLALNAVIDDQITWIESNGCSICAKKLSEMGCSYCGKGKWAGQTQWQGNNIKVDMKNGYGRIEFNATLPSTITQGLHILKVTPVLYSFPITLKAAEAVINISDGLYTIIVITKNVFNNLAALFIHSLS